MKKFRQRDEYFLTKLAGLRHEKHNYIKNRKVFINELEQMMLDDIENEAKDKDLGWDATTIKEEFSPYVKKMNEAL